MKRLLLALLVLAPLGTTNASTAAPQKDGSIYPQLVVSCDDQLNRALLKQFQALVN